MNPSKKTGANQEASMDTVSQSEAVKLPTGGRDKRLANLKPFKPGQSGNPSGMSKKEAKAKKTAEDHVEAALKVIVEALKDKDAKVRLAAANTIMDRGLGKPKQSVEVSRKAHTLDELSTEDLIAAVHESGDSEGATSPEESD